MVHSNIVELEENETDVSVTDFCERLNLRILHNTKKDTLHIATFNVSRPGLQLAGFYQHFSAERVQVVGEQEISYLLTLDDETRKQAIDKLFSYDFPCLVLTKADVINEITETAIKYDRLLLETDLRTTAFINELSIYLNELLAPRITIHGVLIDIYGVGVLIVGKSSVGKSETALELIQRGHRLVADDAVCIERINDRLVGQAPATTKHFMEIRGIGIIDIRQLYGAGAVRNSKTIDFVVQLEPWDESKSYDRLGDETETFTILKTDLPKYTVPVKTGRNLAVILEVATRNFRLTTMGYNALDELTNRIKQN